MPDVFVFIQQFAVACAERTFFGLPTWYHYLNVAGKLQVNTTTQRCDFVFLRNGFSLPDLALIGLAIIDILLRIAAYVAIGYLMYGGFRMITAQGDSGSVKSAQQTMWNALIGLGIAIAAIGGVAFIGKVIK